MGDLERSLRDDLARAASQARLNPDWQRVEATIRRDRARRNASVGLVLAAGLAVVLFLVPGGLQRARVDLDDRGPAAPPASALASPSPGPAPSPSAAPSPVAPTPSSTPVPAPPTTTATVTVPALPPPPPTTEPPSDGVLISQQYGEQGPLGPLGSGEADGSGCTPGAGALPDGLWYGVLTATTGTGVEFDLVCRYSEERADSYTDADYHYSNESTVLRTVPLGGTAIFLLFDETYQPGPRLAVDGQDSATITTLIAARAATGGVRGWLRVEDGEATEFMETLEP